MEWERAVDRHQGKGRCPPYSEGQDHKTRKGHPMSYKSLLTVLTDTEVATAPLEHLAALASVQDGHVDVLCLGVDRTQTGYYYAGANAIVVQETLARAHAEVKEV